MPQFTALTISSNHARKVKTSKTNISFQFAMKFLAESPSGRLKEPTFQTPSLSLSSGSYYGLT
jgi:hypothetical protein